MTKYERALEVVNEAYDGQITEIIANIDIARANLLISENEFRSTLAFLLDEAYYLRNISDDPPDQDIANIIATRLRSTLPYQDIQQVNTQRNDVIEELYNADLNSEKERNNLLDEYIFQSGIAINVDITHLRNMIGQGDNYDSIIMLFFNLGAMLPEPALRTNLDLYYRDLQIANNSNEEVIQSILDRYITEIEPEEDEITLEYPYPSEENNTDHNEGSEELIGLVSFPLYYHSC